MEESGIKSNIQNPAALEKMYRADRKAFETEFLSVYSDIEDTPAASFWKARLDHENTVSIAPKIPMREIITLIAVCLLAGLLVRIPNIFGFDSSYSYFFERNFGLIFFFGLSLYALIAMKTADIRDIIFFSLMFIIPAVYINLLPAGRDSSSIDLAYIHLPLMMWCCYGIVYTRFHVGDMSKRTDYIRYNGDLAVLSAIILIAGFALTAVTIGLFSVIDISLERFFQENIAFWAVASVPVAATFIIRNYPSVANRIAPAVASIFSPLVLLTLVIYLVSIPLSGKNPYSDRDFLLIFNLMLLGVMAIIAFSVTGLAAGQGKRFIVRTLFSLSVVSLLINVIALSAIIYRLGEFGFSPNKSAVLGSNLLVFVNLIVIMTDLFRAGFRDGDIKKVELTIARFLPAYAAWTAIVVFLFPAIFGLK